MEKINVIKQKPITITPAESPGISIGTCFVYGSGCGSGYVPWGWVCGGSCIGFECW